MAIRAALVESRGIKRLRGKMVARTPAQIAPDQAFKHRAANKIREIR